MIATRRAALMAAAATSLSLALASSAAAAFPGTNGQIAFERQLPGGGGITDIFAIGPQGENPTVLAANPDNDLQPSYSADGERIVFARSSGDTIWVMNADGSGQTQLTEVSPVSDDGNPAFSPDGTRIVFEKGDASDVEIWVMDANGQNQVQLTDNTTNDIDPSFSPDGQKIVFSRTGGSLGRIFVMDANGQNPVPLTLAPGNIDSQPDFSPDGTRIAFSRDDTGGDVDIYVMNADGQNLTPLTDNPAQDEQPVFSPDGTRIAFFRGTMASEQIYAMDADGQNQAPLTETVSMQYDTAPAWQPLNPPAIDLAAGKQKSPKHVTVSVVSQNENASVTLDGSLKAPQPKAGATASKKKTVQLDAVTIQLQPGQPVTVDIPVAGKGKKLVKRALKAGKKPKGAVTASATDDLGASSQDAQDVKYKKKKEKD